ncbi:hypothetical protein ACSBR1_004134 [Camellia fascicularis]
MATTKVKEASSSMFRCSYHVFLSFRDHASSGWCLNELVKILERKRTVDHIILPVFYHVDPSHVKKQTGSFAEAFAKHKEELEVENNERKQKGLAKLERWRVALREVADLPGMVLKDG